MGIQCGAIEKKRRRSITIISDNSKSHEKRPSKILDYSSKNISNNIFSLSSEKESDIDNNNIKNLNNINYSALQKHNEIRDKYEVNHLELNDELIDLAQKYAEKCAETDSVDHCPFLYQGKTIGENIIVLDGQKVNVNKICDDWYNEEIYYNLDKPIYKSEYSHFTQMIWKETVYVGFGLSTSSTGKKYFVAYYFPAGNIFEKFQKNVPQK
jgi:uncharacterized protein YkwD